MLYLVKKMKSVQCCGFSLSFWDVGSVAKERLAFAIIMKLLLCSKKNWKVPQGPEFANSGPARLID